MNHQAKLFRSIKTIADFDDVMVHQAKDYFHDYVEKGIILTLDFEAYKWQTTNEYANISFLFNINRFQYKRVYESLFGIEYETFVDYLKSFIVLSMDQHVLISLQRFLRDIKRLVKETKQNILEDVYNIKITSPTLCIDFFSSLPCYETLILNQFLEQLDNLITIQYELKPRQQRQLAQFQSYFVFNDILKDY